MTKINEANKSIIDFAMSQLKQAIEDAKQGKTSNAFDNLNAVYEKISDIENKRQNTELDEEIADSKIIEISEDITENQKDKH